MSKTKDIKYTKQDVNSSLIIFNGVFNEASFRVYTHLYLLPHDKVTGCWYIACFALLGFIVSIPLIGVFTTSLSDNEKGIILFKDNTMLILIAAFILILSIYYIFQGFEMLTGFRRPNWKSKRWKYRTIISFARMHQHATLNPLSAQIPNGIYNEDEWPSPFSNLPVFPFVLFTLIFNSTTVFNSPIIFDTIPGLFPQYKNVPEDVELSVRFSGTFYPDHIEKGSHGAVFAESYSDIHDVIEDQKRYPGLAIIRHINGYSELVVFTDMLEGGTWDEIKKRIAAANIPFKSRTDPMSSTKWLFKP